MESTLEPNGACVDRALATMTNLSEILKKVRSELVKLPDEEAEDIFWGLLKYLN